MILATMHIWMNHFSYMCDGYAWSKFKYFVKVGGVDICYMHSHACYICTNLHSNPPSPMPICICSCTCIHNSPHSYILQAQCIVNVGHTQVYANVMCAQLVTFSLIPCHSQILSRSCGESFSTAVR